MKINVCMHENTDDINLALKTLEEKFGVDFTELYLLNSGEDYNSLTNKPTINQVVLEGALSAEDLGLGKVLYDTTQNWARHGSLVTEKGTIYIYSDYTYYISPGGESVPLAGIKIGDGSTYLIDLPFVTDQMTSTIVRHIRNSSIHVTAQEKEFWNNKVSSYLDGSDLENLVLSKTNYTTQGDIYNG